MIEKYDSTILFFHNTVYKKVGDELTKGVQHKPAFKLILNSVVINTRAQSKLGHHVTYTTEQILQLVKGEDYASQFSGFTALGSNIAFPDKCEPHKSRTQNLVSCANRKNGEFIGDIKIVIHGTNETKLLQDYITTGKYPISVISIEDALKETVGILKLIKN